MRRSSVRFRQAALATARSAAYRPPLNNHPALGNEATGAKIGAGTSAVQSRTDPGTTGDLDTARCWVRSGAGDHLPPRDRRHAARRLWEPWPPIATPPTPGYHAWQHSLQASSHAEIGRVLAHLEQRLAELDRLHREIAEDALALAHAAAATPEDGDGDGPRSVYSIRAAATELGVSVSMLHKLLKQRRLGHLKVGARTLITAEHLEQFREASEVPAPETSPERDPRGTEERSSVEHRRLTSMAADASVVSVAAS